MKEERDGHVEEREERITHEDREREKKKKDISGEGVNIRGAEKDAP